LPSRALRLAALAASLALPAAHAAPIDAAPAAGAKAAAPTVTRIVLRLTPARQPADGARIGGRTLADLRAAAGRPFTVGAPTRTGDQVLVLDEPATPAEAKALVRALRERPGVLRADVERESRVSAPALARAKVANDDASVRYFVVTFSDPATRSLAEANLKLSADHDALLSAASGVAMRVVRPTANGAWVVEIGAPVGGEAARGIAAKLEATPGILHAEPVLRERPHAAFHPNDPYYQDYSQWDLDDPFNGKYYGIDAARAWGITVGSPSVRVAIVDTGGINHPDLVDRWVGGWDFVSDDDPVRDGDGRDPNPVDPGTYDLAGECGPGEGPGDSSWHGSHVAGTIGAAANNGYGTAGIDHRAGLLAIRVLGPCGGTSLDINEGMYWAAGGHVPGVPDNPLPARVINMSLGGKGTCSASRQALIDATLARGALVVVSAGNEADDADLYTPASCYGVSTVVATDAYGYRASYSNYSAYADIAAPGGDQERYDDKYEDIVSTIDKGSQAPTYDYGFDWYHGTSMAAPHVSGVASLMLSVNPSLTPAQMKGIMANTATSFAVDSVCRDDHDCGAGIVNAYYAVLEAAQLLDVPTVQVIEYYHAGLDHHFIAATSQPDVPALDSGAIPGWVRTGQTFKAYATARSGLAGVCRFYIPPAKGDSHFYTASDEECNAVYDAAYDPSHPAHATYKGFIYETGAAFVLDVPVDRTCPPTRVPVWRLWNQRVDTNHRYVTSLALRAQMLARGYVDEGIQLCALP
jgi:serine protease